MPRPPCNFFLVYQIVDYGHMFTSHANIKHHLRTHLQQRHSQAEICQWFEPLRMEFDAERALLRVDFPHMYFGPWFARQGKEFFERAVREFFAAEGCEAAISYVEQRCEPPSLPFPLERGNAAGDDACTLANFIANRKNTFPLGVAEEISRLGAQAGYNPCTLYGKSSCGKTHILQAVSAELGALYGATAVFHGTGATFAERVRKLGVDGMANSFNALVVDDLHVLEAEPDSQELLVRVIDRCLQTGRQLLFACAAAPVQLVGLSQALCSRLEAGLVVEVKEPDLDVRMRFALARCGTHRLSLDREQLLLLAQRCHNFRHLNGVILKIAAFRSLSHESLKLEDIQNILRSSGEQARLSHENIIRTVSQHLSVSEKDIMGVRRQAACVRARQICMYLCRELLGESYPALGRIFGGKDHSTVMHSIRKIKQNMDIDKDMHNLLTQLKRQCLLP